MSGVNRYCVGNRKGLRRATLQGVVRKGPLGNVTRAEIQRKWQNGSPSLQKLKTRSLHLKQTRCLQKAARHTRGNGRASRGVLTRN